MPNLPPTLIDWKAVIPNPNGNFCDQFRAILRTQTLLYQFFSWAFNADGQTPTTEFLTAIGGVGNTTIVPTQVVPGKVTGLNASTGVAGFVSLYWTEVANSDSYYIYRMTTNVAPTDGTVQDGTSTSTSFNDTGATPGTNYYYFVRAHNAIGKGPSSDGVLGSDIAATTGTVLTVSETLTADKTIIVPSNMTKMTVEVWGGGGGGGIGTKVSQTMPWYPIGFTPDTGTYGGGGGGSGYAKKIDYAVSAGESVIVTIGTGGDAGGQGGDTFATYNSTTVVTGAGGFSGGTQSGGGGGAGSGVAGSTSTAGSVGTDGATTTKGIGGTTAAGAPTGLGKGGTGGGANATVGLPTKGTAGYCKIVFSV